MTKQQTPAEVYDSLLEDHKRMLDEILFTMNQGLVNADLKTHTVTGRVKTRESYIEKAQRGGESEPAKDIRDVVGVRIVSLFLSDLPRIRKVIEEAFDVVEVDDKIEGADLTSFGYMSVHFICRLKPDLNGPRYEGLHGKVFEIQSRTIVMDAWANISHHLAYKGQASVPDALFRDFNALSGLFYVADQHFELFYSSAVGSRASASENLARGDDKRTMPINTDTMIAYLRAKFPGRKHSDAGSVSDLVEEISVLDGLDSIQDLDDALSAVRKAALRYEMAHPPGTSGKFADIGLVRTALAIYDNQYAQMKYPKEADVYAQFR